MSLMISMVLQYSQNEPPSRVPGLTAHLVDEKGIIINHKLLIGQVMVGCHAPGL